MTENPNKYDRLIRMAKEEERERIIGIMEYYTTILDDSTHDRIVKHLIGHIIKTIEHNSK